MCLVFSEYVAWVCQGIKNGRFHISKNRKRGKESLQEHPPQ